MDDEDIVIIRIRIRVWKMTYKLIKPICYIFINQLLSSFININ